MSSSDLRSAFESLRSPEPSSSVSSVSIPYFALSSCISCTSCGSLTFQRKMSSEPSMMPDMTAKNTV